MMLSQVWPKGFTPPMTVSPRRWGPAGTMGLVHGCTLPGDHISSSFSSGIPKCVCVCVFVCPCVCFCVCVCVCVCLYVCMWANDEWLASIKQCHWWHTFREWACNNMPLVFVQKGQARNGEAG